MQVIDPRHFTADHPWGALDIERLSDATVRLHYTDAPYVWHVNDGPEVFVVLDGEVDMRTRRDGAEASHRLTIGMVFHAEAGDEHVAHPVGTARVLIVERTGSV